MQSALEWCHALAMLGTGPCPHATRCALAAVPMTGITHRHFATVNAGCTPGSSGNTASPERRCIWPSREHGVQPRVERPIGAIRRAGDKSDARAQRFASGCGPIRATRAPDPARVRIALSAPLLVTFLWRVREKLPAIAGRTPAALQRVIRLIAEATQPHAF